MSLLLGLLVLVIILGLLSGPVRGVSYGAPINLVGLILIIILVVLVVNGT